MSDARSSRKSDEKPLTEKQIRAERERYLAERAKKAATEPAIPISVAMACHSETFGQGD